MAVCDVFINYDFVYGCFDKLIFIISFWLHNNYEKLLVFMDKSIHENCKTKIVKCGEP